MTGAEASNLAAARSYHLDATSASRLNMVERLFRDLTENRMPADLVWAHSQSYEAIEYRCYTSDFMRISCQI